MNGFLKCFYGYRNLGDEILFWGVIDYIDTHYPNVEALTVQVGDVEWMQDRWTRNISFLTDTGLASGFVHQRKIIKFIETSYDIRDNRNYDIYFFGGGEVFAESRGFHGGRNYLLRYPGVFFTKSFVLLGGIETPITRLQKLLYRIILSKAQAIICRDSTSYHLACQYSSHVQLASDFALPVIDRYRQLVHNHQIQHLTSHDPYDITSIKSLTGHNYLLINMISSMSNEDSYERIARCIELYPDTHLVYVSGGSDDHGTHDSEFARWLQGVYPEMIIYDRSEQSLIQTLFLFHHAQAGIGCRLHFLLLLQELEVDRYALVYSEKVKKLIQSTIHL